MNKTLIFSLLVLACAASTSAFAAGNIEAGKEAVAKYGCASCHGPDLNSPIAPEYPKLAGQHADYIAHALKAYQRGGDGANANGRIQAVMGGMAKPLSDKEIHDIAAYVGSLQGNLVVVTESRFHK